jgi:predicted transcriptional regulator
MTPTQQSQRICENLRKLAESHDLTPYQLETVSNMKNQNIYRVYNGRFSPKLETVYELVSAINQLSGQTYSIKDLEDFLENDLQGKSEE